MSLRGPILPSDDKTQQTHFTFKKKIIDEIDAIQSLPREMTSIEAFGDKT